MLSDDYVQQLAASLTSEVTDDGQPARVFTLSNRSGMTATFMDMGATWLSCTLPLRCGRREVLLGCRTLADYQRQTAYLGATVGRFANRISNSQFSRNGKVFSLLANQNAHCLHGGPHGFDKQRWQADQCSDSSIRFSLPSPAGDQGFPGHLTLSVTVSLSESNQVIFDYQAQADEDTPVNLTNHAYFNLSGAESGSDCLDHCLTVKAQHYAVTDADMIPTGELRAVAGTGFDFGKGKPVRQDLLLDADQQLAGGYDHAFVLNDEAIGTGTAVELISGDKRVSMTVMTTKPAVQIYTGNALAGTPGRDGCYQQYQGIAIETQYLPDSPNHPEWHFSDSWLIAGDRYQHTTCYQFDFE
ncbi:galactose-1-epimerase [Photobacterium sp. 2_MG-2023]|uniref:galactose-1-epimerase n=1 Tax=Photobacterium sp. 2_MG-2023 TaxID=3062663 RepID=UPI0026E46B35|nr:galactose-1-epimerase [Photobacterium sp. 2_MG-2023]MDO6582304.1 galactose-1-epimerase [Photobacterium sp. 2_MG-2023]